MFAALMAIAVTKKELIFGAIKALAIGAVIAGIFFLPTLLSAGMPSQAKSDVWGYMWSIPLYGFVLDYLSVLVLIGIFIVPFFLLKKIKTDFFSIRVFLFLLLFWFIQLFVSYRINIVATIALALLVGIIFPDDFFRQRISEYSITAFFALGFAFMFLVIMAFYPVVPVLSEPFAFIKNNSSTNSNVLNEPWLGHAFIFLSERKSSADLAVEYAPEQMIDDSYAFLKNRDLQILKKYGIDYVINCSIFLDEKPVGDNLYKELIEFTSLDKIYSNGLVFVHWVDKARLNQ